jgi:general L-amino acid transport system permease protein
VTATAERAPAPPKLSPLGWLRKRLFQNVGSAVLSVTLIVILLYVVYRSLVFVVINGQWEAISRNLTLFMVGTFPRDQVWRLAAQALMLGLAFGIGVGAASGTARDKAKEAGLAYEPPLLAGTLKRFWSLIAFVLVLLTLAGTAGPWLVVGGAVLLSYIGWQSWRLPPSMRTLGWLVTALLFLAGFQVVSGTEGLAWLPVALVLAAASWLSVPAERLEKPLRQLVGLAAPLMAAGVVYGAYQVIAAPGVGWDDWSGMILTLWWSAIVIVLAFPTGLMLALARRSTLPALRYVATTYIELIRGVPLITLLFMGQFMLGFMLPAGTVFSSITRSIAAGTLFTAAYVAEIVRGGLQSLPPGQMEAGQALGMGIPAIMRRIVLPQALRAVIPAMVGQFISLFKDSSLLFIIGATEFLGVRDLVHAQADFRVSAHAETLVFVAVGYWAIAFSMSRESQRLERRLGVGET